MGKTVTWTDVPKYQGKKWLALQECKEQTGPAVAEAGLGWRVCALHPKRDCTAGGGAAVPRATELKARSSFRK